MLKSFLNDIAPWDTAGYVTSKKEAGNGQLATDGIKSLRLGGSFPDKGDSIVRREEIEIINCKNNKSYELQYN